MHPDGSDSLLLTKNMPMGLIEYAVNVSTASSVQKVITAGVVAFCHEGIFTVIMLIL